MTFLFNIRGYNGSGKSTIPHEIINKYGSNPIIQADKIIAHQIKELSLILIGKYTIQCGGGDSFPNKKKLIQTLIYIIKTYPEYNILLEGIFISTSKNYYIALFKYLKDKYNITPIIIFLTTPLLTCEQNIILHRKGKIKLYPSTYNSIIKQIPQFKQHFNTYTINNTGTKQELLQNFERIFKYWMGA